VTFSWILLYKEYADPRKAAAVKELLRWCLTDGQQSSAELGYIRLAPNVATAAVKAVDSVKP
jgi:phosphate transport system substrate-binding protein